MFSTVDNIILSFIRIPPTSPSRAPSAPAETQDADAPPPSNIENTRLPRGWEHVLFEDNENVLRSSTPNNEHHLHLHFRKRETKNHLHLRSSDHWASWGRAPGGRERGYKWKSRLTRKTEVEGHVHPRTRTVEVLMWKRKRTHTAEA